MEKLKVFACGCLHGDTDRVSRAVATITSSDVDLIVLVGDFVNPHAENMALFQPFLDTGKPLVFVSGNHDGAVLSKFLSEHYSVHELHGKGVRYNHVGVFGVSGANVGIEQLAEDEFLEKMIIGHEAIAYLSTKLMVSHIPPSGTLMDKMSPFVSGSTGVRKAIEKLQPDVMLCAHIHEAAGMEFMIGNTRVINVCHEGKIVEL